MINGLYSGAAAMDILAKQQEIISDNLMHANSSGHRRTVAGVSQRFDQTLQDLNVNLGPQLEKPARSFQPGRMVNTERTLDMAIQGDGFFAFEHSNGLYLTRDGRVYRDPESGTLVNSEGFPLQGENGPITIDTNVSDREITIGRDGTLKAGNRDLGKIKILSFVDNQKLVPNGSTAFSIGPEAVEKPSTATIAQFQHELSNVEPITELVALIINTRQHQAVERATRTFSDSLSEYIRS